MGGNASKERDADVTKRMASPASMPQRPQQLPQAEIPARKRGFRFADFLFFKAQLREEAKQKARERAAKEVSMSPALYAAVASIVDPAYIEQWLAEPNEAIGGITPMQALKTGQESRIWDAIQRLQHGDFS